MYIYIYFINSNSFFSHVSHEVLKNGFGMLGGFFSELYMYNIIVSNKTLVSSRTFGTLIVQSIYEILDYDPPQIPTEFFFPECTFKRSLEWYIKNAPKSTLGKCVQDNN